MRTLCVTTCTAGEGGLLSELKVWKASFTDQMMVDAVEPQLWRNDCGTPFEQVAEATSEQKALYAFAKQKIDNPFEPFDVAKYPLPPGYLEFLNVQEAFLKTCRELKASANT